MNYKIVNNYQELESFIDFLPELLDTETYYFSLIARGKYAPDSQLGNNKNFLQLRRFTSTKDRIFEKIKQLECEVGSYKVKGLDVPQEALVLYVNINPRDQITATRQTFQRLGLLISEGKIGEIKANSVAMTELHRARGRKLFYDIDFDLPTNLNFQEQVKRRMSIEQTLLNITGGAVEFINTRGGFHALVKLQEIPNEVKKTWYHEVAKLEGVDIKGDNMIPVPGTTQGGFVPSMYLVDEFYSFNKQNNG